MIYFIQIGADGPIKIGYTGCSEAPQRLAGVQTSCPYPLRLLGSIPGDRADERRFHNRFASHRTRGEWFLPHPDVLAVISPLIGKALAGPEVGSIPLHDILNALPARLYDTALEIAARTKVSIADVLTEAVRDGLKTIKPQWDRLQGRPVQLGDAFGVSAEFFDPTFHGRSD